MIDVMQQEKNLKTVVELYKKIFINKIKLININPIVKIKNFFDFNKLIKICF